MYAIWVGTRKDAGVGEREYIYILNFEQEEEL